MISPYYLPYLAGAELYVKNIAEYLVKNEHKVAIITKRFNRLKKFERINNVDVYRIKSFNLPQLRSLIALPGMFFKTLRLSKDYDLIHAHITYPSGIIAYFVKLLTGKKYILTLQGDELMNYPEKRLLKLLKFPIKIALKNASYVHCISNALKDNIVKNFGVDINKVIIIPNGVDIEHFKNAKKIDLKKRFNSKNIILTVSRLTAKNNIELLIKSVDKLKNVKLIIIGDGPEKEKLKRLSNNNVIFIGRIDNKEIASYMKGADIFIRTPITEGLGIVFLEAMAAGLSIISNDVGGIKDIVKDNYNSIVVKNNVEDIKNAIETLLKDKKLREKLASNGLKFVKDYDWGIVNKRTIELYN